jgi:RNA polymerase sigma factor (TIGR02999 family)
MSEVPRILDQIQQGDPSAADQLMPLVYQELRKLAAQKLANERPGQTLEATGLVHEAYLRLVDHGARRHWNGRRHFFAAAAEAMRRILVESARRKRREKHGGNRNRVPLDDVAQSAPDRRHDLLALDAALTRLAAEDAQAARLVELRHFAGLTVAEAAQVLGISPRTTDRVYAYARAWLYRDLASVSEYVEV